MHFVVPHVSWLRMQMRRVGAMVAVTVFAPCVLWWRVQRVGVAVAVFTPCVLWSRVWRIGSRSWSSHTRCGATVAIDAPRVSRSQSLCRVCCGRGCGAWSCGRGPCAMCVTVAVLVPCVSRSWSLCCVCRGHGCALCARGVGPPSLSMWHMCRGHGLCAVCHGRGSGVSGHGHWCGHCAMCIVIVAFALHVVLLSPFSHHVGCCRCLHCVWCGVAAVVIMPRVVYVVARGVVTGRPGETQCGTHS